MKFEQKISGTKVTDFDIVPIFKEQIISLEQLNDADLPQYAMDYILDTIRFSKGYPIDGKPTWWCTLDWDTILKLSCIKNHRCYVEELKDHFGENWLHYYIRFNH